MLARRPGNGTAAGPATPPPFKWVGFEPASLAVDAIENRVNVSVPTSCLVCAGLRTASPARTQMMIGTVPPSALQAAPVT